MNTEKKLVLWYPSDWSACGYLRSYYPNDILNNLYANKRQYEGICSCRFILDKDILPHIRTVRFQRQIDKLQIDYMETLKEVREKFPEVCNYKIVYDTDDLFSEVPVYNPFHKRLATEIPVAENLKRIKSIADIITVSTFPLKKKIEEIEGGTNNIKIVPNYIPKFIYGKSGKEKTNNTKPKVVWAGSSTHFSRTDKGDFSVIFDLVKNTLDDFEWVFLGIKYFPDWMLEFENKIKKIPWSPLYGFPDLLKSINADFGVAPLISNSFNICKSNIKMLDYYSAGLIGIFSEIKPYEEAKVFFKGDWKQDKEQILEIFNNQNMKDDILKKQERLLNKYWLEDNYQEYLNVFGMKMNGGNK